MRTLYLDLASHEGVIAAVADERILASQSVDHRVDDADLLPVVESVLKKAEWSYPDLTQIACVIGPGGFTSLRVAVALANALGHELKIPSCGVHLSEVYIARMTSDALWLHSTKKHELFVRDGRDPPRCISIDELKGVLKKGTQWMGELITEHRQIVVEVGAEEMRLVSQEDLLPGFLKKQHYQKQILRPWYGRGW